MQKDYQNDNNRQGNVEYYDETVVDVRSIIVNAPSVGDFPPIVQPLSFVPYSTSGVDTMSLFGNVPNEEPVDRAPKARVKRKAKFVPIFLSILSLLIIAVMVIGKYFVQDYLAILGTSGLDYIMYDLVSLFKAFTVSDAIIPCAVALIALFALLNFICGFCTMFSRGASGFSKVCLFFMTVLSLVLVFIGLANGMKLGYGLLGILALSVISFFIAMLAKKN